MLELLEDSAAAPDHITGPLLVELGQCSFDHGLLDEAVGFLERAEESFDRCKHNYGSKQVDVLRLLHSNTNYQAKASKLCSVMQYYHGIDYQAGMQSLAHRLQQLAFAERDMATFYNAQRLSETICIDTGQRLIQATFNIILLGSMAVLTGSFAKVVESGEGLFRQYERQLPYLAHQVAGILSRAFQQGGKPEDAVLWAKRSLDLCIQHGFRDEREAAYNLCTMKATIEHLPAEMQGQRLQEVMTSLENIIADDQREGRVSDAVQKMAYMAQLQYSLAKANRLFGTERISRSLDWVQKGLHLADTLKQKEPMPARGTCLEWRITLLLYQGESAQDTTNETQAFEIAQDLAKQYNELDMPYHEATKYVMMGLCAKHIFEKTRLVNDLLHAETAFRTAATLFSRLAFAQMTAEAEFWLSSMYVGLSGEGVLAQFAAAEQAYDRIRRETSILGGLRALLQKQSLTSNDKIRNINFWALQQCLIEENTLALWSWSQKGKARSVSDMLGLGLVLPKEVSEAIAQNDDARQLLENEQNLERQIQRAEPERRALLRQEQESCRVKQAQYPELVALQDLRTGGVPSAHKLVQIIRDSTFNASRRDTVYLDWVAIGHRLYLLVLKESQPEKVEKFLLSMSVFDLDKWYRTNFNTDEARRRCLLHDSLEDPHAPFRALDCLIAPIAECSKSKDLMILSPTGKMHTLPLHALGIEHNRKLFHLIDRNPVVYASNSAVLEKCVLRAAKPTEGFDVSKAQLFAVYEDEPEESTAVYRQVHDVLSIAGTFSSTPKTGSAATKSAFTTLTPGARLIHVHGHCRFETPNVLEQCLILSRSRHDQSHDSKEAELGIDGSLDGRDFSKTITEVQRNLKEPLLLSDPEQSPSEADSRITVEELFRLELASPHVTLIACGSATQTISTGDEPLGIITGMLCAGAASVLGTLWPIQSKDGRTFSEHFYMAFTDPSANCIDLAVALQRAVRVIKKDLVTESPYHWAAFVLHGAWEFRRKEE